MFIVKKYRSEWKYVITEPEAETLKQRLEGLMEVDEHAGKSGYYAVSSLYFDDLSNSCARENIAGERTRFKYRIRYYGESGQRLFLERKEKVNAYCHKMTCEITPDEYAKLVSGACEELLWEKDRPLLGRFALDILEHHFCPKSIVNYERLAFVEPICNIRITIDKNIFASDEFDGFLTGEYTRLPVSRGKERILEVKFDEILPSYIRKSLQAKAMTQQAFSKYYQSRMKIRNKNKIS